MKKLLFFLCILTQNLLFSQITLSGTIDGKTHLYVYSYENDTKYFDIDYNENKITIYDDDLSIFKTVIIPLESGDSFSPNGGLVGENIFDTSGNNNQLKISKKLINDDNDFEFCTRINNSEIIIFNDSGNLIERFESNEGNYTRRFYFFHDQTSSSNKLILNLDRNGVNVFEIYDLPSSSLSTNEINSQKIILGFPNPTSDFLNISSPNISGNKIEIFDSSGRLVLKKKIDPHLEIISINVKKLTSGIYFYKIGDFNSKFIKK